MWGDHVALSDFMYAVVLFNHTYSIICSEVSLILAVVSACAYYRGVICPDQIGYQSLMRIIQLTMRKYRKIVNHSVWEMLCYLLLSGYEGFHLFDCSAREGLDLIVEAIEKAGYTGKVKIGIDVAASEFYTGVKWLTILIEIKLFRCLYFSDLIVMIWLDDKKYDLDFKTPNNPSAGKQTGADMINLYKGLCAGE